jgi:hypothetical protein
MDIAEQWWYLLQHFVARDAKELSRLFERIDFGDKVMRAGPLRGCSSSRI